MQNFLLHVELVLKLDFFTSFLKVGHVKWLHIDQVKTSSPVPILSSHIHPRLVYMQLLFLP